MEKWLKDRVVEVLTEEFSFVSDPQQIVKAADEVVKRIIEPKDCLTPALSLKLEDSDTQTFGLVIDTEGLSEYPGYGAIIGMWSKSPVTGCFHFGLMKSVDALVDDITQRWARKISEMRDRHPEYSNYDKARAIKEGPVSAPKAPKVSKVPKADISIDEETGQLKLV